MFITGCNTPSEWVKKYRILGLNTLPAKSKNKSPSGFTPPINWVDYQNTFIDEKQIKTWLMEGKFQNIFIILGKISNNIIEIDVDCPHIDIEDIFKDQKAAQKKVWISESSQGKKKIYAKAKKLGKKKDLLVSNKQYTKTDGKKDYPHVEYRPDGHGSIVPPSIHPDGTQYQWLNLDEQGNLPELPSIDTEKLYTKIVDRLRTKYDYKPKEPQHKKSSFKQFNTGQGKQKIKHCFHESYAKADRWSGPEGHEFRSGLACELIQCGYTDEEIHRIFETHDKNSGEPYDYEKTDYQIKQLRRKNLSRWNCSTLQEKCPTVVMKYCNQCRKYLAKKYHIYKFENKKNDSGEKKIIKTGVNWPNIAELIYNEYDFNFFTTQDNKELYYYEKETGIYRNNGETTIRQLAEEYMGRFTTKHYKNEIQDYITDKNYQDRTIFNNSVNLINLKNGIFNLRTGEFFKHSPQYKFLNSLPVNYNPDAKINHIYNFLEQILKEEDIPIIQELIGFCFYRSYSIQKAFMFIGEGANGKSTLISLIKNILGMDNVTAIPIHHFEENRFAKANLYGKLANLYPDLSNKALSSTGEFKMLTGGDMIEAEIKFKGFFRFISYAKQIFSCNTVPYTHDNTSAYYRRWIPLNFPYSFYGSDRDPYIIEKITTPEEISGLFNFGLKGLKRLLSNGHFSYTKTTDEIQDQMERLADPVNAFVKDELSIDQCFFIIKDDLYESFKRYADENNVDVLPKQTFTKNLQRNIQLSEFRPKINGERPRCYKGIRSEIDLEINHVLNEEGDGEHENKFF